MYGLMTQKISTKSDIVSVVGEILFVRVDEIDLVDLGGFTDRNRDERLR